MACLPTAGPLTFYCCPFTPQPCPEPIRTEQVLVPHSWWPVTLPHTVEHWVDTVLSPLYMASSFSLGCGPQSQACHVAGSMVFWEGPLSSSTGALRSWVIFMTLRSARGPPALTASRMLNQLHHLQMLPGSAWSVPHHSGSPWCGEKCLLGSVRECRPCGPV
jgi:hypothetical protein